MKEVSFKKDLRDVYIGPFDNESFAEGVQHTIEKYCQEHGISMDSIKQFDVDVVVDIRLVVEEK
jgi:hypothetical protein